MTHDLSTQSNAATADEQQAQWPTATRYMAAAFLIIGLAVLLLFLVPVISTVALGFIFAFLMYLLVRALVKHTHMRYPLAVVLLYVLLLVLSIVLWIAVYSLLHNNAGELSAGLQEVTAELETHETAIRQLMADMGASAGAWLAETLGSLVNGVLGLLGVVAGGYFFSFLLLLAMGKAGGSLSGWVRPRYRREATLLLTKLDHIWQGYMASQVVYGIALGVLSFFQYALLGVPYPFVMAAITGYVSLIPTVGGLLASVIVAIPCLLLGSTVLTDMSNLTFALLVLGINIASMADLTEGLSGLWEFNDAGNLTIATIGNDLILRGTGQQVPSQSEIAGVGGSDVAVAIGPGSYYQCAHGIPANGGSASWVNEYTLLFDVNFTLTPVSE